LQFKQGYRQPDYLIETASAQGECPSAQKPVFGCNDQSNTQMGFWLLQP